MKKKTESPIFNLQSAISNPQSLRVLFIEDSEDDALLLIRMLKKSGYAPVYERVETATAMGKALREEKWDIIFSDYKLPNFTGPEAIALYRKANIDIPFIIVSGTIGEETAVECMRLGAHDYIMKDNLSRLVPALEREIVEAGSRAKRRHAETALRESEEQYRTLADSGVALIWTAGSDKKCNYFNLPWLKFTGRTLEQEMGDGWTEGVHPDDLARCFAIYAGAFDRREHFSMIYRLRHHSGEYRWIQDDGTPRYDLSGNFIGYIGHCLDITDRMLAEQAIHDSERRFKELFENMSSCVAVYQAVDDGKDFVFIDFNRAAEIAEKINREQVIGKSVLKVFPGVAEIGLLEVLQRVWQTGKAEQLPAVFYRDGRIYGWRENHVYKLPTGEIVALYNDITERKKAEIRIFESEEKYRLLVENSSEAVFILQETMLQFVNRATLTLFNYSYEVLTSTPFAEFIYPEDREKVVSSQQRRLRGEKVPPAYTFRVTTKDGITKWVEIHSTIISWQGKPATLNFLTDISERMLAEEKVGRISAIQNLILENSSLGIALVHDRVFEWANNRLAEILKLPVEKIQGATVRIMYPSDAAYEEVAKTAYRDLAEGKRSDNVFQLMRSDGDLFWCRFLGRALNPAKPHEGSIWMFEDITERIQMEDALQEAQKQLQDAYHLARIGSWSWNCNKKTVTWSDEISQMAGLDKQSMVFPDNKHPHIYTRESWDRMKKAVAVSLSTSRPQQLELEVVQPDGNHRWVNWICNVMHDKKDKIIGLHGTIQDITKRRQAEEAVRESEELFRKLFENHSAVKLLIDADTEKIIDANNAAEKFYGWPKNQLLRMSISDINTLSAGQIKEAIEKVKNEKKLHFEFRHRIADGSIRDVEVFSSCIEIKGKKLLHSVIHDITERKRAEEKNKINEARMESLLKINMHSAENIQALLDFVLNEAIVLTGSEIGYIYLYDESKKEFTLNSWSQEVMKQCAVTEPQTVYQLEKTGIWGEAVRQRRPIMLNDFTAPDPLKKGLPRGHAVLHKYLTIPVFCKGHIVAVIGVANKKDDYNDSDIRQLSLMMDAVWKIVERKKVEELLKASEKKYRNIFENAMEGIFQSTLDGRYISLNPAFARIRGFDSPEEMIRMTGDVQQQAYVHIEERTRMIELLDKQGFVNNFEIETKRKDGSKIWVSMNSRPIRDENGKIAIIEGTIMDITERKNMHVELQKKNLELARAYEELKTRQNMIIDQEKMASIGMLSAGVAHEIKNPLAVMLQGINYLQSPSRDDSMEKEVLSRLYDAVRRADVIVKGLLSYARQTPLSLRAHNIQKLIDDCLSLTEHELHKKNIRIVKNYSPDLSDVIVDMNQIQQVCINLIINGIEAMSKDGVLTISTKQTVGNEGKTFMEVVFADTGHGIPADKLVKIFDPFYTTKAIGSTGLGLSISRGIIEKHGGTLTVESEEGHGASMIFKLPVTL